MIYEYANDAGERKEVLAPMSAPPPPERIQEGGIEWRRIWSVPAMQVHGSGGVEHKGQKMPVSMSLPFDSREGAVVIRDGQKVREHPDGTMSTLRGDRIIRNGEDMKRHCAHAGYVHEPS